MTWIPADGDAIGDLHRDANVAAQAQQPAPGTQPGTCLVGPSGTTPFLGHYAQDEGVHRTGSTPSETLDGPKVWTWPRNRPLSPIWRITA